MEILFSMNIQKHAVVTLKYKLFSNESGSQVEETTEENPLVFLFGVGGILPDFETNLDGKTVGDTFDFSIAANDAYGAFSEDNIVNIPLDVFKDEAGNVDYDVIKVGGFVPMVDNEGNHMRGQVNEVTAEHVRMDFNHPMAGQDLHFTGEILDVRMAEEDEIAHGHVHGAHGHQH